MMYDAGITQYDAVITHWLYLKQYWSSYPSETWLTKFTAEE